MCMDSILEVMAKRERYLETLLSQLRNQIQELPTGTLRISRSENRVQYYYRLNPSDRTGRYLKNSEISTAKGLAQKDYLKRLEQCALKELQAIKAFRDHCPDVKTEEIYSFLSKDRQKLIEAGDEAAELFIQEWKSVPVIGKEFDESSPEFFSDGGIRVRSKSELLIANELEKRNLPYRYEYPVTLDNQRTIDNQRTVDNQRTIDNQRTVYPDFMVLNTKTRTEYLWEHFGMMDNPEYANKAVLKQRAYTLSGYFPGKNLIITWETKTVPISMSQVKMIIDHYLM